MAFYLLPVLALFVLAAIHNYKKKRQILTSFISENAYKKLGVRSGREIDFFKTFLVTGAMTFFIFALSGPQWGEIFEEVDVKGIEVSFLLDTSNSMSAEDLKPNRFEVAKMLITGIVDNLKTDYVSLINFAGKAYVQCPLTVDYGAFKMLTEASTISPAEEQGTDFGEAFTAALKTFEASKSDKRLLLLITDGEDQEGSWFNLVEELKKQEIFVFTVGVGAQDGAPIPVKNKDGEITGWKKDRQGNIVKTRLDENTLIQVASHCGGQYFRLTDAAGVDSFLHTLKAFERKTLKQKVKLQKKERFYFFLIPGIILLMLELILSERKLTWRKKD
ncbi:MAG: VWA domain-containing protein [Candidatus Aminicenantes bacterium]|nr:VWA domain-containing protein [Candidatus Aminicenantes bacterium]